MTDKIYNITSGCDFDEVQAGHFMREYRGRELELTDVLFLLPNRRAVKALKDAFVRLQGLAPTLLPQMLPIGDVEEDELFLTGFDQSSALATLAPAISRAERLLLFTKIIMAKPIEYGIEKLAANQACYLAQELANLIDTVHNQGLSFDRLTDLVPEEYAVHWQETLKFLQIITEYWPQILAERQLIDASDRRNRLLRAQIDLWRQNPPVKRIVAAGTTAAFPLMKELVKTVLSLEKGELYLAGIDKFLEDEAWEKIDETHPQHELKELLDYLTVRREDIPDLQAPENFGREVLISEVMRPAATTEKWRDIAGKKIRHEAADGITLVNCADMREEALTIALLLREAVETPEKTAALVTGDRNLARRVAAELERWNLKVDDSAGKPLALTPLGIFLRLTVQACEEEFRPVAFLSLLKHPLTCLGEDGFLVRKAAREYEKKVLRSGKEDETLTAFVLRFKEAMRDLAEALRQPAVDFKNLLALHIKTAEVLAAVPGKDGAQVLWKGDAGEAAAAFIADLYAEAGVLGEISGGEYRGLLEALMAGVTVRPKYGTHPRLSILGPIEARLVHFDRVIIGEVNENIWPQAVTADPWMSRPMKREFGFPLPERTVGVGAYDFSQLLANEEVYLTRAERVAGTPMVKSRWWMRLETVLKALNIPIENLEDVVFRSWARFLDRSETFTRLLPPAPKPPVSARPRELSASAVEYWMRDPYIIFAKYILRLKKLDDLEQEVTFADYGTIIHAVLEQFNRKYNRQFPPNAKEELLALGRAYFAENEIAAETRAFWWPHFEKTVDWLVTAENDYRPSVREVHNEVQGRFRFEAPAGPFTITAKADRVDETADGRINIIDYKTGEARSPKEVRAGYAPQLPIEALIAREGGFDGIPAKEVAALIYWQLGRKETRLDEEVDDILNTNLKNLRELATLFDFPDTAYISKPNPRYAPKYSDYEQLARVKEWSVVEEE